MTLNRAQQERERYNWLTRDPKHEAKEIAIIPDSDFLRTQFIDLYAKIGLRHTEKEFYRMAKSFHTYVVKKDGSFELLKDYLKAKGLDEEHH